MTIRNLPALIMRDQIKQLCDVVSQPLHDQSKLNGRRTPLCDNWEEIDDQNRARKDVAISMLFDGRDVAAGLGSEFWLYCISLTDVAEAKKKLHAYGYKYLETFVPKVGHPDDKKISINDPDPRHAFAIRVNSSTGLIFGDHAEQWLDLHKQIIDVMRDEIIYTYCHNTDARFHFASKEAAAVLYTSLLAHYANMQAYAQEQGKEAPAVSVKMEKSTFCMFNHVVYLDYERQNKHS